MTLDPEQRQRWLALAAAAAVAILVLDRMVLTPYARSWRERAAEIEQLELKVSRGRSLLERADFLEQRWHRMQRDALAPRRPAAEETVLKQSAKWARESHVRFTSLTPQWRQPEPGYEVLECRAGLGGNLEAIVRFLYALERDPVAIRIEEFQLAADDEQGRRLNLNLRFSGLRLVRPQSANLTAGP
jgi:hypothetical protein